MSRYFTSDWHLGSSAINKYAHRPFANASENAVTLVDNCNAVAHDSADVVFHVGDFWLNNADRHGDEEDVNLLTATCKDYIRFVSARLVLLAGNHDDGHNCETDLKDMRIDLNHNYRNVYVSHFPSNYHEYKGPGRIPKGMPFIALCGHVHDKWLLKYDRENHVLNINVGVDVWNYKPVRDSEITEILDFVFDTSGPNRTYFDRTWSWTRKDLEHFQACQKHDREQLHEIRKKERYAKKGLTPEECERRKQEAMRRKGLI